MFKFGVKSYFKLRGAKPELIEVLEEGIKRSPIDFTIGEVLRTQARQQELLAAGASTTMNSRHLTGHAADVIALVGGKPSFDWPLYYKIAEAMREASQDTGIRITWGGVWDRNLGDLENDLHDEVNAYIARRQKVSPRKKVFLDGPHFELSWKAYP